MLIVRGLSDRRGRPAPSAERDAGGARDLDLLVPLELLRCVGGQHGEVDLVEPVGVEERQQVVAEHVLGGVGSGWIHRSAVALEPVARELMKAGVLLARVELECVRWAPGAAADQRCDLVAPVGCAHVVPAFSFGAERDPVARSIGADSQAVDVLAVAFAIALDDRADGVGTAPLGGCVPVLFGHARLRGLMEGTTHARS